MQSIAKNDSNLFAFGSGIMMIACLFVMGRAFAGVASDEVPALTVKYQDLNLASPAGVAALYGRIHAAARQVCHVEEDQRDLSLAARAKSCADESEARAVKQVNVAELTAYHQSKTGRLNAKLASNGAN